jgi:hypothetical protein
VNSDLHGNHRGDASIQKRVPHCRSKHFLRALLSCICVCHYRPFIFKGQTYIQGLWSWSEQDDQFIERGTPEPETWRSQPDLIIFRQVFKGPEEFQPLCSYPEFRHNLSLDNKYEEDEEAEAELSAFLSLIIFETTT